LQLEGGIVTIKVLEAENIALKRARKGRCAEAAGAWRARNSQEGGGLTTLG
jgi:hypothetical protein